MKKLFPCLLLLIFIGNKAISQKVRLGFGAGATLANMYSKVDGEKDNGDTKIGFTAGLFADIPLSAHASFQPGLNFTQKGTKDKSEDIQVKMNLNYLEIPLNVLYNSNGNDGNFFIGAGPSLAFGISGKTTVKFQGEKESASVHFGNSSDDDLKRFDLGANLIAGYCFKGGFRVAFNYNHGLSNLFPGGSDDGKIRSGYLGLGVGYFLGSKK